MEIKEAIEKLNNLKNYVNCGLLSNALLSDIQQAFDTVLEELNNRIPRKDIEDLIKDIDRELEILDKKQDDSIIYFPRDICNAEKLRLEELDKSNKRINMCIDLLNGEGCLNFDTKQEKLEYIDKLIKLEGKNE